MLVECRHTGNVTGVADVERERVTIQEAARRLGVSESAIRKRVQRGTLQHHKGGDGRVYVYLDLGEAGEDNVRDTSRDELVDELRDRVRFLQEELQRKDAILLRMAERIPELQSAQEAPESPLKPVQRGRPRRPRRPSDERTAPVVAAMARELNAR